MLETEEAKLANTEYMKQYMKSYRKKYSKEKKAESNNRYWSKIGKLQEDHAEARSLMEDLLESVREKDKARYTRTLKRMSTFLVKEEVGET